MAANITAATAVVDMVYNILALGDSTVRQATFSTRTVNVRPDRLLPHSNSFSNEMVDFLAGCQGCRPNIL